MDSTLLKKQFYDTYIGQFDLDHIFEILVRLMKIIEKSGLTGEDKKRLVIKTVLEVINESIFEEKSQIIAIIHFFFCVHPAAS